MATIAVLLCSLTASAHDFEVDGFYYNIISEEDWTVEITYQGDYAAQYNNEYTGAVIIPQTVTFNGKSYYVISIGDVTFSGCEEITSLVIPNGLISIGNYAFLNCRGLTSLVIPASVENIYGSSFANCSLTSIVVEEGNPVYDSRKNCNAIIRTEDNSLVVGCVSTVIPDDVTLIQPFAFAGRSGLTSISIPESVTFISNNAFEYCGLTSVYIHKNVTSITDGSVFEGCESLISIIVDEENPIYDSRNNCNAIINTATNTLVSGCSTTKIPVGVKSIGSFAFTGHRLGSITIPEGVTSIGDYAFSSCELTSIIIPEGVLSIGNYVFDNNPLATISIPESLEKIGRGAFEHTLWYSNQKDGVVYLDDWALGYKGLMSETIEFKDGMKGFPDWAFVNSYNLIAVTLPASVKFIGLGVFQQCEDLKSVTLSQGITSIGKQMFAYCSALSSVNFPSSLISIDGYAFYGCANLSKITIPESVTTMGRSTFDYSI